jgi:hypothetical protein
MEYKIPITSCEICLLVENCQEDEKNSFDNCSMKNGIISIRYTDYMKIIEKFDKQFIENIEKEIQENGTIREYGLRGDINE